MNLVTLNTAEQNEKIAADFRNNILPDDQWEIQTAVLLNLMDAVAANGHSAHFVDPGELVWKNQQGVSILEFLQKKGYTCSIQYDTDEHRTVGYFTRWRRYHGAAETVKELNEVIRRMSKESGYNKRVKISTNGSVGVTLDEAMMNTLNPLKHLLRDCEAEVARDKAQKLAAYEKQKAEAEALRAKLEKQRAEIEDTKNQIFFFIGAIVAIVGVFLMFK